MPFYPFGGGQPKNPDVVYEYLGFETNGAGVGTNVTSGGSAFAKGAWVSLGVPSADLCEVDIIFTSSSGSGHRVHCDIGVGPSQTIAIPDLYTVTSTWGTTFGGDTVTVPRTFAAGVEIWARISAQAKDVVQAVALRGVHAHSSLPPGFDNCEVVHGGQATGRAGTVSIPMTGAYQPLVASTARAYGALVCTPGQTATTVKLQDMTIRWATGDNPNEVDFFRSRVGSANGNPVLKTGGDRTLVRRTIPANERLSVAAAAAASDTIFAGIHGLW